MLIRLRPLLLASVVASTFACWDRAALEPADRAEAAHTEGDVAWLNSPYVWSDTDYETFRQAARVTDVEALPAEHAISRRLQPWVDAIHAVVSDMVKARTGQDLAAPHPVLKVLKDTTPNAWVTPIVTCAGGAVDLRPLHAGADAGADAGAGGGIAEVVFPHLDKLWAANNACVNARNWSNREGAVPWYDSLGGPCRLEPAGREFVARGDACKLENMVESERAKTAGLNATSPFISITTRLVGTLGEEKAVAAILAHELGHYYRGHANSLSDVEYWYDQVSPPRPGRPPPAADSARLKRARELSRPLTDRGPIEGERYSRRLRPFWFKLGGWVRFRPGLDPSCARVDMDALGQAAFTLGFLKPEVQARYLAALDTLVACASTVAISSAAGGAGALDTSKLGDMLGSSLEPEIASPLPAGATVGAIFDALDARARPLDAEGEVFLSALSTRHLGLYTTEQEADDLSMDLLARLGVSPKEYVESLVASIMAIPGADQVFEAGGMPMNECLTLFRAGWSRTKPDGTSEYVYVPLGSLDDPHHGLCYRLFNISREMEAHAYSVHGSPPVSSTPWSEIQAMAKALTPQEGNDDLRARPFPPSAIVDRF